MENSKTSDNTNDVISKIQDQTPISILIEDLESSSKLQTEEGKALLLKLSQALRESYIQKERELMTKFAFDFYSDVSRGLGADVYTVNCDLAEMFFDETFNKK
jgi:hypothetical protein